MMINLILDCSCGMNVFVVKDEKVFSFEDKSQSKHSDEILKVIDELLNKAKVKIKDVNNICVCVGPGSFTGVRVAVSIVKGLAVGTCAKLFVLTNFEVFEMSQENSCLVLDGFSNFVYVRKFKNGASQDICIEIQELSKVIMDENLAVYHTTEKTQNLLEKFEINSEFVKNNIIFAFNKIIKENKFVEINQIYPVYLRASQAEIEREKKKNGI